MKYNVFLHFNDGETITVCQGVTEKEAHSAANDLNSKFSLLGAAASSTFAPCEA